MSERFPLYPIIIGVSLKGDAFNFIEVSCPLEMQPNGIIIQLSNDGDAYNTVGQLKFLPEQTTRRFVVRSLMLPKLLSSQFLKLVIGGYLHDKNNLCRQIGIYGLKLYNRCFENTKFLFNLEAAHIIPRSLLELLKCLEWIKYTAKQESNLNTCIDCQKQIDDVQKQYSKCKESGDRGRLYELEKEYAVRVKKLQDTTLKFNNNNRLSSHSPIRHPVIKHQNSSQLHGQSRSPPLNGPRVVVDMNPVPQDIQNLFGKYLKRVSEIQLKLVASDRTIDQQKFIINMWTQIKDLPQFEPLDEELLLDTLLYFVESSENKILSLVLQVLTMALKKNCIGRHHEKKSDQLLGKLLDAFSKQVNSPLHSNIQEVLLLLFEAARPDRYIDILVNRQGESLTQLKLSIIMHILNHHDLKNHISIINYIKKLFKDRELPKDVKSISIDILAIIASKLNDISEVMEHFNDLPTHVMLNLEKLIKERLGGNKSSSIYSPKHEMQPSKPTQKCQYCHIQNASFIDSDLYDLHCFRDCIGLTKCRYCEAIIEITHLYTHYLKECTQSRNFKKCGECGISIHRNEIEIHDGRQCLKRIIIMCPLCNACFLSKQDLNKHILSRACPKNERAPLPNVDQQ